MYVAVKFYFFPFPPFTNENTEFCFSELTEGSGDGTETLLRNASWLIREEERRRDRFITGIWSSVFLGSRPHVFHGCLGISWDLNIQSAARK